MTTVQIIIDGIEHLTPEDAAARAGMSLPTLRRRVKEGLITPRRVRGRTWFAVGDVERLRQAPYGRWPREGGQ